VAKERQIREIIVRVDAQGDKTLKELSRGFNTVNKSIKETTTAVDGFRRAFLAIQGLNFAGIGFKELTNLSDTYQKLSDRITVFEGSQIKATQTLQGLAQVADNTRSSIQGVATIYSRLALSLDESDLKSRDLLFITEQLQNSFRLSGSTAAEATAATIQLSQGLASGTLRGQELRSVLESNAVIGGLLSKQLGSTRGNLLKLAEAGKITSDVFLKALANGSEKINTDVQNLGITFQEATDRGVNKFTVALGELNKQLNLSGQFDKAIQGLTNNLGAFSAVAVGLAATTLPNLISGFNKLRVAIIAFAAANPATLLFAGIATAASFAFFETDKFVSLVLKARQGLIFTFADLSQTLFQVAKGLSLVVSLGKGDFLTDFTNKGIAATQALKDNAVRDIAEIEKASQQIAKGNAAFENPALDDFEKKLNQFRKSLDSVKNTGATVKNVSTQIKELNESFNNGNIGVEKYNQRIIELTTELFKKKGPIPLAEQIDKLQRENLQRLFEFGKIGAEEFQTALNQLSVDQLEAKFSRGRITIVEYLKESERLRNQVFEVNKELRNLSLTEFNRQLSEGLLSLEQYNDLVNNLKLEELNDKFKSGAIDIFEYNKAITETSEKFQPGSALFTGVSNYITSAGTLSQNIANGITNTFGNLENSLTQFVTTGKASFKDFATAVLEDLNRIIIRSLIIRPLAQGILGGLSGAGGAAGTAAVNYTGPQSSNFAAKGAAFDGNRANFFAKGGVVSGYTPFTYGQGQSGVMGEKGPEAILPLTRNSQGELGVKAASGGGGTSVIVNVHADQGAEIQQEESTNSDGTRVLDIYIQNKVKEGFAQGAFDATMRNVYNLRRKG